MNNEEIKNIWPDWEFVGDLGDGTYGEVYEINKVVSGVETHSAVKRIRVPNEFKEKYVRELEALIKLKNHPNIINIEDFALKEKPNGNYAIIYIRMEILKSFKNYFEKREIDEMTAAKIGIDICTALEICKNAGIIHRDIKPGNILIDDRNPAKPVFKLGDFGIALLESPDKTTSFMGTKEYMAPEIAKKKSFDATVDIYSLGMVLYKLTNNNDIPFIGHKKLPTDQEIDESLMRRSSGEPLPRPASASDEMCKIIMKACEFDPADRYQDPSDMKRDLNALLEGEPVKPAPARIERTVSVTNSARLLGREPIAEMTPRNNKMEKNLPVRSSSDAPAARSNNIPTFSQPKKESRIPGLKIIAGVLAIAAICGIIFFMFPQLSDVISGDKGKIDAIISEADDLANAGDYEAALRKIKTGLVDYDDSDRLKEKQEEYEGIILENNIQASLDKAEKYSQDGDYLSAMNEISSAKAKYGESAEFTVAYDGYMDQYEESVIDEATGLMNDGDYSNAITILTEAKSKISDTSRIDELLAQANSHKPIPLANLKAVESDDVNVNETVYSTDTLGNSYSTANLLDLDNYWYIPYVKYYLNKEYKVLKFTFAPRDESTTNSAQMTLVVDGDGQTLYSSSVITRTSVPETVTIDISNVEWLTITTAGTDGYGHILVADPVLSK